MEAVWHAIWQGVRADFSDVPEIVALTQLVLRMLLASLLGGLLGYQREWQGKAAGLRTHMLVALGSAFFVLIPLQAGMELDALSRVLQGLLAGIGFLLVGCVMTLLCTGGWLAVAAQAGWVKEVEGDDDGEKRHTLHVDVQTNQVVKTK